MGEWADDFAADTAPTGAGGDPYAGDDAYPAVESADTQSLGVLPGGSDGSFTPFSPNQGFDYSDILGTNKPKPQGGGFDLVNWFQTACNATRGAVDGYLNAFPDSAYGALLPLKKYLTSPGTPPRDNHIMPVPGGGGGGMRPASQAQAILHGIRMRTGMRVTQRSIVHLIVRYGFGPTAAMTQAPNDALLFLFMREKGTTHHRRGPGLYTIARKMRRYASLQHQVARILGRGHRRPSRHHRRKHYAFHKRKR